MCICFYTLQHPRYSLVLISNRDEFMARPTLPAHWYDRPERSAACDLDDGDSASTPSSAHRILSGVDVTGGGTWLGIEAKSGRFGILTNVREEDSTTRERSRGELVEDWLSGCRDHHRSTGEGRGGGGGEGESPAPRGRGHVARYLKHLETFMQEYAGFNLFLGQILPDSTLEMGFLSNRSLHIHTNLSGAKDKDPSSLSPNQGSTNGNDEDDDSNSNSNSNNNSNNDNNGGEDYATDGCTIHIRDTEGFGVMSNGALACGPGSSSAGALDRAWPKMEIGQKAFQERIVKYKNDPPDAVLDEAKFVEELFEVLRYVRPVNARARGAKGTSAVSYRQERSSSSSSDSSTFASLSDPD